MDLAETSIENGKVYVMGTASAAALLSAVEGIGKSACVQKLPSEARASTHTRSAAQAVLGCTPKAQFRLAFYFVHNVIMLLAAVDSSNRPSYFGYAYVLFLLYEYLNVLVLDRAPKHLEQRVHHALALVALGTMTYIGFQGTEKDDLWFVVRRNTLFFVVSNLPYYLRAAIRESRDKMLRIFVDAWFASSFVLGRLVLPFPSLLAVFDGRWGAIREWEVLLALCLALAFYVLNVWWTFKIFYTIFHKGGSSDKAKAE